MELPRQIGPYEIRGELGRGAVGVVFRAWHESLEREVALKTLIAGAKAPEGQRIRFLREGRALAKVSHPNVVAVHAAAEGEGGVPFIAMDLVEGESLEERIERGETLGPEVVARIGSALASALVEVHRAGIVHRDLKPGNVILTPGGQAILADFGLVKDLGRLDETQRLTQTGRFVGSPHYWSPEQAEGDSSKISPATDLYALGGTLYAALTGVPPIGGANLIEIAIATREQAPTPIRELRPEVPRPLERVILRCLAKDPSARPASAEALKAELDALLVVHTSRLPALLLLATAFVLFVLLLGVVWATSGPAGRSAPSPSATASAKAQPAPSASPQPSAAAAGPSLAQQLRLVRTVAHSRAPAGEVLALYDRAEALVKTTADHEGLILARAGFLFRRGDLAGARKEVLPLEASANAERRALARELHVLTLLYRDDYVESMRLLESHVKTAPFAQAQFGEAILTYLRSIQPSTAVAERVRMLEDVRRLVRRAHSAGAGDQVLLLELQVDLALLSLGANAVSLDEVLTRARAIVSKNPDHVEGYRVLAHLGFQAKGARPERSWRQQMLLVSLEGTRGGLELRRFPRCFDRLRHGHVLFLLGRFSEAYAQFKEGGVLDPNSVEARMWQAIGRRSLGDAEQAAKDLRRLREGHERELERILEGKRSALALGDEAVWVRAVLSE